MTTELDDKVRAALREWTDALPVAVPTRAMTATVVPLRAERRRWMLAAVSIAACAVLIAVVWVVRDRDGKQLQPAATTTLPVDARPSGSGLFLSQTQFRASTVNPVMLVQTDTTTLAGAGAQLQHWADGAWTTTFMLPVARMGETAAPAVPGDTMATDDVGIQPQQVLHVELPTLEAGTYRIVLTDAATAVFDVCADCTPAPGPPNFEFADRVDPAVITDTTTSIGLLDSSTGTPPVPTADLTVARWTGENWVGVGDTLFSDDLSSLKALPDGTYKLWNLVGESWNLDGLAGFFVQHSTPTSTFEIRGVGKCQSSGELPDGRYRLPDGQVCPLHRGVGGEVFLPDAAVVDADGTWTVTASLRPTTEGVFNSLASGCYAHGEECSTGQLAFVLNDQVISVATVQTPEFSGSLMVAVDDEATANALAAAINDAAAATNPDQPATTLRPADTSG